MGFRIGLNSALSIDGDPYLWNFGHSPGKDISIQGASFYGGQLGVFAYLNGQGFGGTEQEGNIVSAEPYTYESLQTYFRTFDEYNVFTQSGWNAYYGGSAFGFDVNRTGAPYGGYDYDKLTQSTPGSIFAYASFYSRFYPTDTREMLALWNGTQITGGPAVSLSTKYGYSLDAKSGILVVGQPYHSAIASEGRMYVYNMNNAFLGTLANSTLDGTSIKSSVTSIVKSGTTCTINMSSSANMPSIGQLILFSGITGTPASTRVMTTGVFKVTGTPTSTSFTVSTPSSQTNGTITTFPAGSDIRVIFTNNADLGVGGSSVFLGSSVAISDNGIIACGAESSPSITPHSGGAVLIYLRSYLSGGANSSIAITPHRVIGTGVDLPYKRFGSSVAIIRANSFGSSQNKLYVGSPGWFSNTGIVNVYNLDSISELSANTIPNEHGNQRVAQITPSSVGYTGPASRFGETVAAGEGLIAISAPEYSENGFVTGAVFLVRATDHSLVKKITPPPDGSIITSHINFTGAISNYVGTGNTTVTLFFTAALPISVGDKITIEGAFGPELSKLNGERIVTETDGISSYVRFQIGQNFTGTFSPPSSTVGTVYRTIKSPVDNSVPQYGYAQFSHQFGFSIAIGSGRIVIGDPFKNNNNNGKGAGGAYYIYDTSGNLINIGENVNYGYADNNGVGTCVAIGNGKIFVGSPNHRATYNNGPYGPDYLSDPWEPSVRTGLMRVLTLDGRMVSNGHKVKGLPTDGYESDYPFNNNNWDIASPYSGFGWACAFYNDTLYVSTTGGIVDSEFRTFYPGEVNVYKNITRTYTIYDALQLQKGMK